MNYYLTDKTTNGFYTAVCEAYRDPLAYITSDETLQPSLLDTVRNVQTKEETANRVKARITEWDPSVTGDIFLLLRYEGNDREQIAFGYLKTLIREKRPVRTMFSDKDAEKAISAMHKITLETHRLTGFLRFTENEDGILYAPISPDHDILDLLMPHFEKRMGSTPFLIQDTKRGKIGIWNGTCHTFAKIAISPSFVPSQNQDEWETLWKSYYRHVNIALRLHEKQMKAYMPVRYWTYLPEKN